MRSPAVHDSQDIPTSTDIPECISAPVLHVFMNRLTERASIPTSIMVPFSYHTAIVSDTSTIPTCYTDATISNCFQPLSLRRVLLETTHGPSSSTAKPSWRNGRETVDLPMIALARSFWFVEQQRRARAV